MEKYLFGLMLGVFIGVFFMFGVIKMFFIRNKNIPNNVNAQATVVKAKKKERKIWKKLSSRRAIFICLGSSFFLLFLLTLMKEINLI